MGLFMHGSGMRERADGLGVSRMHPLHIYELLQHNTRLVCVDDICGMCDSRNVTQECKPDVDEEISRDSPLEEDA